MGVVTRAKKRRLLELEEEERHRDRISSLPDDVLGDIVTLLPTKDGARTQVLSSRWRHLWRSALLNLDLLHLPLDNDLVTRILSVHRPGAGRRFCAHRFVDHVLLDDWFWSSSLDNLEELEFRGGPQPPPSVHRFWPTLRVARFNGAILGWLNMPWWSLQLRASGPVLNHLTLAGVTIYESSLQALLAACPVLLTLALLDNYGVSQLQIVSSSLRSIGVRSLHLVLRQLVIEDAPCLERLLYFGGDVNISIISAPRLAILGNLCQGSPRLQIGDTVFKGATIDSKSVVVRSVRVLALHDVNVSLDVVLSLMQCFPRLQKLYIKLPQVLGKDWDTHKKLTSTLDIDLRKIVLRNYQGSKSHINLARFFVSNAKKLKSMRFEVEGADVSATWIEKQQRLLHIKKSASSGAQFDFVSPNNVPTGSLDDRCSKQVQDLLDDPFDMFH